MCVWVAIKQAENSLLQFLHLSIPCNMESSKNTAKKAGPSKLPSKQIVFGNQPKGKKGQAGAKASVNTVKKGGVNNMRKLSGM